MSGGAGRIESKSELELILLIVSFDPESTVSRLTSLKSIGSHRLQAEASRSLHDIYLDTPEHALGRKRINLRIREMDDSYWITMKTSPGLFSRKRHERQEVEIPWSIESLGMIVTDLKRKGIRLSLPKVLDEKSSPLNAMRELGLSIVQDRETQRIPRSVLDNSGSGEVLAELEIDSVVYHFAGIDVRLYELELEAKSQKGRKTIWELSQQLLSDNGTELRSWRFGKLVTGEKIERLRVQGRLTPLMEGNRLKPEAYSKVERA